MRTLSYTILFLLFITMFTSCKTDSSGSYRTFYTAANKEYAAAISIGEARAAEEAELLRKEKERIERKERKEAKKKQKGESVQQNIVVSVISTEPLSVIADKAGVGSVQATQGGVSQQSAEPKDPSSVLPVPPVPMIEAGAVESKSELETKSKEPVVLNKKNADTDKTMFRKAKITAEEGYEGQLKKYSVVIASLSKKEGVERLKLAFEEAEEPVVIAKNNKGIYYFILGSYDEKDDAVEKRAEVREKYVNRYSRAELLKQYAIPFSDVWIAVNE